MAISRHHSLTATSFIQKGVDAASKGSLTQAEQCFRQAFLLAKQEGGAFNLGAANLIRLLHQQKRSQAVVDVIEELGSEHTLKLPQICILMAAESAFRAGHYETSKQLHEFLYTAHPRDKTIALGYSQSLLALSELKKARIILEDYLNKQGPDAEVITNAAAIALESGRLDSAEKLYRTALSLAPNHFVTHYNLGKFLQSHGSLTEAIHEFDRCLKMIPKAIEAITAKAETLIQVNRQDEALALYKAALQHGGLNEKNAIALIKPLIAAALSEQDNESCKHYLGSISSSARSDFQLRSIIYDLANDIQEEYGGGSNLYDPTKLVMAKSLISEGNLLQHLANYIINNESLIPDRPGKPTRGGSQTHEIMLTNDTIIAAIKETLEKELIAYAQQLPEPIRSPSNAYYRLSGWGVSLESDGRQLRHTHPEARVSGVLYVAIPEDMNSSDPNGGSLVFSNIEGKANARTLQVTPENGKFVMFPSYIPHETVAFQSKQKRVCLAVNLIEISR